MAPPSSARPEEEATPGKKRSEQAAAVCLAVINVLGRPRDLFRVSAVRLWGNHYRVNVQTGEDASSVRIPHSFFVTADEAGNVLESVPQLTRVY